jgi:hypothetical protein
MYHKDPQLAHSFWDGYNAPLGGTMKQFILLALIALTALTACGAPQQTGAEAAVTAYINAINEKDATRVATLSCGAWEFDAMMELDAFQAVSTTLEGLTCKQVSEEDNTAIVNCEGKILATYDGEQQVFDLSVRNYVVENSSGEWLVCGVR